MTRLTINLTQDRYRALKQASAERGMTISQLIEESLDFQARHEAMNLVRRARAHAGLDEARAVKLATSESRAVGYPRQRIS